MLLHLASARWLGCAGAIAALALPGAAVAAPALPDAALFAVPWHAVLPPEQLPALPEPAMVIMMLLGVGLIGYRARRAAAEPFQ